MASALPPTQAPRLERLGPRLRAVAGALPAGLATADVGSGDGQLCAWLAARDPARRLIAVELGGGPLRRLRERLVGLPVECRQGDGLAALSPGEVEVAVLAGLGGRRIAKLLEEAPEVARRLRLIVVQPMQHAAELRRRLRGAYLIERELLAVEAGRTYTVLLVRGRADAAW